MPETGARADPFLAFRFTVRLDDLTVGGFSECSGLVLEIEVHDHPEGGLNTHLLKFPTRTKQTNLVLKRGIADRALWDWFAQVSQGQFLARNGSVAIRDPAGEDVLAEWQFREAFPTKWQGPDLNATQNSVAVETLELCHQGLERQR
jgi:phage tail-like protein